MPPGKWTAVDPPKKSPRFVAVPPPSPSEPPSYSATQVKEYGKSMAEFGSGLWNALAVEPYKAWERAPDVFGGIGEVINSYGTTLIGDPIKSLMHQYSTKGEVAERIKQFDVSGTVLAAIPWFGPALNEAIAASAHGDAGRSSAILTQIGLQLAAAKAAPKIKEAARSIMKEAVPPEKLVSEIRTTIAPLTEGAPPTMPELGRNVKSALEQPLRVEEQGAASVKAMNVAETAAAKERYAGVNKAVADAAKRRQEEAASTYGERQTLATEKAKAETEKSATAQKLLQQKLNERRDVLQAQKDAEIVAQERAVLGESADLFGPLKTQEELGLDLGKIKENRAKAILTRETRNWRKAKEIAVEENTEMRPFKEVYGFEPRAGDPSLIEVNGAINIGPLIDQLKTAKPTSELGELAQRIQTITNAIPEAQRSASPAYQALIHLRGGKRILNLSEAIEDASALFNLGFSEFPEMKTATQGLASRVSPLIHKAIKEGISNYKSGSEEALAAWNRGRAYTKLRHETFERGPGGVAEQAAKRFEKGDIEGMVLSRTPQWQQVASTLAQVGKSELPAMRRRVIEAALESANYAPAAFSKLVRKIQPEVRARIFTPDQNVLIQKMGIPLERPKVQGLKVGAGTKYVPSQETPPTKYAPPEIPQPPQTVFYVHMKGPAARFASLADKEPVAIVRELVKEGDASIEALADLDRIAPIVTPQLAKGTVDAILREGNVQDWFRLGSETKQHFYGPELTRQLDGLFTQLRDVVKPPQRTGIKKLIHSLVRGHIYRSLPGGLYMHLYSGTSIFESPPVKPPGLGPTP